MPLLRSITNLCIFRAPVEGRERDRKVDGLNASDTPRRQERERWSELDQNVAIESLIGPEAPSCIQELSKRYRLEGRDRAWDRRMQTQKVTACALKMPGLCRGGDWTIGRLDEGSSGVETGGVIRSQRFDTKPVQDESRPGDQRYSPSAIAGRKLEQERCREEMMWRGEHSSEGVGAIVTNDEEDARIDGWLG